MMTTQYAGSKRGRSEEGEGETSRTRVQGTASKLTNSTEVYGKFKSMELFKKMVGRQASEVQFLTYYFGKLTKSPLSNETTTDSVLSYSLKNQENQTIPVGPVQTPSNATNASEYPLHIYSLCNRNATPHSHVVGHFMYSDGDQSNTGGMVKFGCLTGLMKDGTTATNKWEVWQASDFLADSNFSEQHLKKSYLKNVRVEFMLRGCPYYPTQYQIELVSFDDDDMGPNAVPSLARDSFFLPLVRKKLGNPIASNPQLPKNKQLAYVWASWKYYFEPTLTTEVDKSGPMRVVNLNINCGQRIDWNWTNKSQGYVGSGTGANVDEPNKWTTSVLESNGDHNLCIPPNWRQRLFLIVRATAPMQNNSATPSYDIAIKPTHVWNASGR
jgi:hypothetical protein